MRLGKAALLACALVAGCGIVGSDYVPTEETFRRRAGTFILDGAATLEPTYGNIDVNSMFGKYVVVGHSREEVLAQIGERALEVGWTTAHHSAASREFHRPTPGTIPTYEIARVVCTESPLTVHVAWLQVHHATKSIDVARTSEGEWAEREFWPRFERAVKRTQVGR
jgi:hypothetical protein